MNLTLEQLEEAVDKDGGFCIACGAIAFGIEQDARKYECEHCGEEQVYGASELIIMGYGI